MMPEPSVWVPDCSPDAEYEPQRSSVGPVVVGKPVSGGLLDLATQAVASGELRNKRQEHIQRRDQEYAESARRAKGLARKSKSSKPKMVNVLL